MSDEINRIRQTYRRREELGLHRRYSPANRGHAYIIRRYEEETLALLKHSGLENLASARVLDLGCGRGQGLANWARWGVASHAVHGIELIERFASEARRAAPTAKLTVGSADRLPYRSESFDIVAQHTMFTSILDAEMRHRAAAEMRRVLVPSGCILWFDFRYSNPVNPDVRGIELSEIRQLFPGWTVTGTTLILLPPLARALAPLSVRACRLLEACAPWLRSHHLLLLRRPQT